MPRILPRHWPLHGDAVPGAARFLLSDRRRRLERLALGLAEYDRKRDHRYAREPKGDEQRSITDVVRLYAGEDPAGP